MSKKNAESVTAPTPADDDFMHAHEKSARVEQILFVRFLVSGQMIASPRDAYDSLTARKPKEPAGYDIFLHVDEQRFRFVYYNGGKVQRVKYLHASRAGDYETMANHLALAPDDDPYRPSPNSAE